MEHQSRLFPNDFEDERKNYFDDTFGTSHKRKEKKENENKKLMENKKRGLVEKTKNGRQNAKEETSDIHPPLLLLLLLLLAPPPPTKNDVPERPVIISSTPPEEQARRRRRRRRRARTNPDAIGLNRDSRRALWESRRRRCFDYLFGKRRTFQRRCAIPSRKAWN